MTLTSQQKDADQHAERGNPSASQLDCAAEIWFGADGAYVSKDRAATRSFSFSRRTRAWWAPARRHAPQHPPPTTRGRIHASVSSNDVQAGLVRYGSLGRALHAGAAVRAIPVQRGGSTPGLGAPQMHPDRVGSDTRAAGRQPGPHSPSQTPAIAHRDHLGSENGGRSRFCRLELTWRASRSRERVPQRAGEYWLLA